MSGSLFAPLGNRLFRALWFSSLAVNLLTIMEALAAAWLMTSLTTSPFLVAMVQVMASLPALLLALPSGVLADAMGKRKILVLAALWSAIFSGLLAILIFADMITPWILLGALFLLYCGRAAKMPAWQAVVQDVVGKEHLPHAISLNSMSFNGARTLGPALGGFVIATLGSGAVFVMGMLGSLGLMQVCRSLKHPRPTARPTVDSLVQSLYEGGRFVFRQNGPRSTLIRLALFVAGGVPIWAMLPLLARERFGVSAFEYGLLVAAFGVASLAGAGGAALLRRRIGNNTLFTLTAMITGVGQALIAWSPEIWIMVVGLAVSGGAWVMGMVSINITMQQISPPKLRARAMGFHLLTINAAWATGSIAAGWLSTLVGPQPAMLAASVYLILTALLGKIFRLPSGPSLQPPGEG